MRFHERNFMPKQAMCVTWSFLNVWHLALDQEIITPLWYMSNIHVMRFKITEGKDIYKKTKDIYLPLLLDGSQVVSASSKLLLRRHAGCLHLAHSAKARHKNIGSNIKRYKSNSNILAATVPDENQVQTQVPTAIQVQTQFVLPSCLTLSWNWIQALNCHLERILNRCWMWDLVLCIGSLSRLPSNLSICSTTSALLLRKAIHFPFCIMCHIGCLLFREDAWGLVWPEVWVCFSFRFRFCSWAICPLPCFGDTSRGLVQSL